jgi:purine-binding chemotaxis protein CheW
MTARYVSSSEQSQYLTFLLDKEMFAMGILAIKEIIEYHNVTPVPMMPAWICGVINLRGAVVPVLDLAVRFGRRPAPITKRTCIVIAEVQGPTERQVVGVLVDAVSQVLDIPPTEVEPPPTFGARIRTEFMRGMGKVDGRFVILLDVDHVLSVDELGALPERGAAERPANGPSVHV